MTMPPALQNLIADLRDRNLLPVVIGLVVAILAVPVVLGRGAEETPTPSSSSAELAGGSSAAPEPVVLASVSDVRAYRERLQAYEKKDPFAPIAEPKKPGGGGVDAGANARALVPDAVPVPGDAPEPPATPVGGVPPAGTDEPPAPTPEPEPVPEPDPAPDPDPSDEPDPADEGDDPAPEPKLLTPVVDVAVGPERHVRRMNRVTLGDYLPNRTDPIAQYVEGSLNGKNATFLLSPAARSFEGDGRCEPDRTKCKALVLEPGETAYIYDEIGTRYTLKLAEVRVVEISEKQLGQLDFEPGFPTKRRPSFDVLPTSVSSPPSL